MWNFEPNSAITSLLGEKLASHLKAWAETTKDMENGKREFLFLAFDIPVVPGELRSRFGSGLVYMTVDRMDKQSTPVGLPAGDTFVYSMEW